MVEQTVKVLNRAGLHARPAMILVQLTLKYNSSILIEKEGKQVNAKSIMGVITMAAHYGTELKIIAEGDDEEEAVAAIVNLFNARFKEDDDDEEI